MEGPKETIKEINPSWQDVFKQVVENGLSGDNIGEIQEEIRILELIERQRSTIRAKASCTLPGFILQKSTKNPEAIQSQGVWSFGPRYSQMAVQRDEALALAEGSHLYPINLECIATSDSFEVRERIRSDESLSYDAQLRIKDARLSHVAHEKLMLQFHKFEQKSILAECSHQRLIRAWETEKKNLLETISILQDQMQTLERDYEGLRGRFSELQKSSRFIDLQIKSRSEDCDPSLLNSRFPSELESWPKDKEIMDSEIQSLRRQLASLTKQSKYQDEQQMLSRKEVNNLILSQKAASDDNLRLRESVFLSEQSKSDMSSQLSHLTSKCSIYKSRSERFQKQIADMRMLSALRVLSLSALLGWKDSVRAHWHKRGLARISGVLAARTQRRSPSLIRASWAAWGQRALMRCRGAESTADRRAKLTSKINCAWRYLSQFRNRARRICNHRRCWRRAADLNSAFSAWRGPSRVLPLAAAAVRRAAAPRRCAVLAGAFGWWVEASRVPALTLLVAKASRRTRNRLIWAALRVVQAGATGSMANSSCTAVVRVDTLQRSGSPARTCPSPKDVASDRLALATVWQPQLLPSGERQRRLRAALRGWSAAGLAGAAIRTVGEGLLGSIAADLGERLLGSFGRWAVYSERILPALRRNTTAVRKSMSKMSLSSVRRLQRRSASSAFWHWTMFTWVCHGQQRRLSAAQARSAQLLAGDVFQRWAMCGRKAAPNTLIDEVTSRLQRMMKLVEPLEKRLVFVMVMNIFRSWKNYGNQLRKLQRVIESHADLTVYVCLGRAFKEWQVFRSDAAVLQTERTAQGSRHLASFCRSWKMAVVRGRHCLCIGAFIDSQIMLSGRFELAAVFAVWRAACFCVRVITFKLRNASFCKWRQYWCGTKIISWRLRHLKQVRERRLARIVFIQWVLIAKNFKKTLLKLSSLHSKLKNQTMKLHLVVWCKFASRFISAQPEDSRFWVVGHFKHACERKRIQHCMNVWTSLVSKKIIKFSQWIRIGEQQCKNKSGLELSFLKWLACVQMSNKLVASVYSLRFRRSLSILSNAVNLWRIFVLASSGLHRDQFQKLNAKLCNILRQWKKLVNQHTFKIACAKIQNVFCLIKEKQRNSLLLSRIFACLSETILMRRPCTWMVCNTNFTKGPTWLKQFQVQKICLVQKPFSKIAAHFHSWRKKWIESLILTKSLKIISRKLRNKSRATVLARAFGCWRLEHLHAVQSIQDANMVQDLFALLSELLDVYGEPLSSKLRMNQNRVRSVQDLIFALDGHRVLHSDLLRVSEVQGTLPPRVLTYGPVPHSHVLTTLGTKLQQGSLNHRHTRG